MGMSSSQARLLNLTARMHQIEYKAAKLEAQKLQMANESRRVYEDYLNALDASKVQKKFLTTSGAVSYVDATYNNLIGQKIYDDKIYMLTDFATGKVYTSEMYKHAYECSNGSLDGFLTTLNSLSSNSSDSYTSISTVEDLLALSESSGNYRLDADLVLTDWEGITNFSGIFDGNGHTITISGNQGLFKTATNATIKNISLDVNLSNTSASYIGGLIGYGTDVVVDNCSATGIITSETRIVGGLFGAIGGNSQISNCNASANLYSNFRSVHNGDVNHPEYSSQNYFGRCGGVVGYTYRNSTVVFNDCTTEGASVNYSYWQAGGFVGQSNGDVILNRCVADNEVVVNYNGYGDDYVTSFVSGDTTYNVPHSGSTLVGFINTGTFTANDCNIYGSVSTGGHTSLTKGSYSYANSSEGHNFNNCYSATGEFEQAPVTITEPSVNPTEYPNIDSDDFNEAVNIFEMIKNAGGAITVPEGYENSTEWLTNMINSGNVILSQIDLNKNGLIHDISISTDTNLQEVTDESKLKKAEAKYEADMKRIDLKDRRYDIELSALDSERNAIKQEIETLKQVSKDNVERTFKLFS